MVDKKTSTRIIVIGRGCEDKISSTTIARVESSVSPNDNIFTLVCIKGISLFLSSWLYLYFISLKIFIEGSGSILYYEKKLRWDQYYNLASS